MLKLLSISIVEESVRILRKHGVCLQTGMNWKSNNRLHQTEYRPLSLNVRVDLIIDKRAEMVYFLYSYGF
jgi:hypothetical protein